MYTDEALFLSLWEKGYRFIGEDKEDNLAYGLHKELSPGKYEITTLKGLREMAKQGLIVFKEKQLSEEDLDFFLNAVAFVMGKRKS